jgi:hypothetical protein
LYFFSILDHCSSMGDVNMYPSIVSYYCLPYPPAFTTVWIRYTLFSQLLIKQIPCLWVCLMINICISCVKYECGMNVRFLLGNKLPNNCETTFLLGTNFNGYPTVKGECRHPGFQTQLLVL